MLNGERGHYEIAKGDRQAALMQLKTIVQLAGVGGLIPEQIWDSTDIADKNLFNGESAGSTKPLVWAHAEYIQLLRSFMDNAVFGMPPQPTKRYLKENTQSQISLWSFTHKCSVIQAGKRLRIQAHNCGRVHWTTNQWKTCDDLEMVTNELNIFYADLPLENLAAGSNVTFTFFWPTCDKWEGCNYEVMIKPRNGGWKGSSDARF